MSNKRHSPPNPKQGERLKEILRENNCSQGQLSIITGCSQQSLSRYANSQHKLPIEIAEKIGRKFNVRPAWLLGLDDWKRNDAETLSAMFDRAWVSQTKAEELLIALGIQFQKTDTVRQIERWYIAEDNGERKSFTEDDKNDRTAYRIVREGKEVGQCSINDYDSLIDTIIDHAEKAVKVLTEREEKDNG